MLKVCLESFFAKLSNELPIELIVMDNASTDDTKAVLEKYSQKANVRIVLNQKNLRLNAYKPLFGMARGEYIVDIDDDIIEFPAGFDKSIVDYYEALVEVDANGQATGRMRPGLSDKKNDGTDEGCHPNVAGYEIMEPLVKAAIKKVGVK